MSGGIDNKKEKPLVPPFHDHQMNRGNGVERARLMDFQASSDADVHKKSFSF